MEYEIYYLCNLLGIIILLLIILFHFIDADHDNAKTFVTDDLKQVDKEVNKQKAGKSKKDKKKTK